MSSRLYLREDGRLTPYALAVGYEEHVEWAFGSVRLYLSSGRYHVASSATAEHRPFADFDEAHAFFADVIARVEAAMLVSV